MAINTQLILTDVYVSVPLTGIAAEDITDADATIKNIKTGAATEYIICWPGISCYVVILWSCTSRIQTLLRKGCMNFA